MGGNVDPLASLKHSFIAMNGGALFRVVGDNTCGRQTSAGAMNCYFAFRNLFNAARRDVLVFRTRCWHTRLPFTFSHAMRPSTMRAFWSPLLLGDRLSTALPIISWVDSSEPSNNIVLVRCLLNLCALTFFKEFRATSQLSERSSSLGAYNVS